MKRAQWLFWSFVAAGTVLLLLLFEDILLPFLVGFAFAYFLDPAADRLEEWGLPRGLAAGLVLGVFILLLVTVILALWPVVAEQTAGIVTNLPAYVDTAINSLLPWLEYLLSRLSAVTGQDQLAADEAMTDIVRRVVNWLGGLLSGVLQRGVALFNLLSLIFIMPIVAYFLLKDWDLIVAKVDGWLPRAYAPTIREQARQIDAVLSGYLRGQAIVCLILAVLYAVGWSLVGLDYALLLGLLGGILAFVPYVGGIVTFVLALAVAAGQFWPNYVPILFVIAAYVVIQTLEGNFLTPKLVGDRVGLSPLWVIFALLAGGSLFGLIGVLLAVPLAAIIGVLARAALTRYLESRFYAAPRSDIEESGS